MPDENLDRLRSRIAWVIVAAWIACFPLAILVESDAARNALTVAQIPMMAVCGWLFASPLIRRNGGDS